MEKRIAEIISVLLHPLLMPTIGFLLIINSGTYVASLDYDQKSYMIFVVVGLTFLLPASFIPLYLFARLIKRISMPDKRDRIVPLYITLTCYLVAFLLIQKVPVSRIFQSYMLAACLILFFVMVISHFWKISAHLAGLGGIVALILSLSILLDADLILYMALSILLTGIAAYARLKINAHDPLQVYSGFLLGFGCMLFVFMI